MNRCNGSVLPTLIFSVVVVVVHGLPPLSTASGYTYVTDFFEVPLDHFSFAVNSTFKIRYLFNDTYWKEDENGPILFYTGNEGNVETFANNTGFMWELAEELGAMILFAEHRFYGQSFPEDFTYTFSDNSVLGYLTVEQTIADYAKLIRWLKQNYPAKSSPVIAFGGSYGGQLTACLRMKYPHLVIGGIAASAPLFLTDVSLCELHDSVLTSVYKSASSACYSRIRESWTAISSVTLTAEGMNWLTEAWKLCSPIQSHANVTNLKDWLNTMYGDLAMVNYPYQANFLRDLPGNPVKAFCHELHKGEPIKKGLNKDQLLLSRLYQALNMYFNYTGSLTCLDYGDSEDIGNGFSDQDGQSWDFQSCTEIIDPSCDDGIQDFFERSPWNLDSYTSDCQDEFGYEIVPRLDLLDFFYGGRNILAASNIVFSNGMLDPWYGYGVLKNMSDTLIAIVIENAAHHLDLRGSNPNDPPSVINAREQEKRIIKSWIQEYHDNEKRLKELFPSSDL